MNLPNKLDLSNYSSNWIKFLRHDYDQIVDNYIKESELICLLKKQSFSKVAQIIAFLKNYSGNEQIPSYEYILSGFYDKLFNFIDILDDKEYYC